MRTFWYLRILEPPCLLKNVTDRISESWILMGSEWKKPSMHPWHYLTPLDTPKHFQTPYKHPPGIDFTTFTTPKHSQDSLRGFSVVKGAQRWLWAKWRCLMISAKCHGSFLVPRAAFRNVKGMSVLIWWRLDVFRVSRGCLMVWGCLNWYFWVFSTHFPLISISAVTFFSRSGGPRILKYQNART